MRNLILISLPLLILNSCLSKSKKSTIITLEVVSGDQVFSKVFAEELLKQTSDLYIDIKTGNLSRSIYKIQLKTDSLLNIINNNDLQAFKY